MIEVDLREETFRCPYCGCAQVIDSEHQVVETGWLNSHYAIPEEWRDASLQLHLLKCSHRGCGKCSLIGVRKWDRQQVDFVPNKVWKEWSVEIDIPEAVLADHREAAKILSDSPKAAATLLRRCLQGMIRDFWGICKNRLVDEIEGLKECIPAAQWAAIDALRKLGNVGAHMEKDVGCIVDIDEGEAERLLALVELLIDKWYVARYEERKLLSSIVKIADEKKVGQNSVTKK